MKEAGSQNINVQNLSRIESADNTLPLDTPEAKRPLRGRKPESAKSYQKKGEQRKESRSPSQKKSSAKSKEPNQNLKDLENFRKHIVSHSQLSSLWLVD